jgi:hypothetical protein
VYHKEVAMSMVGDGPEGQPTEGVTLDSLVSLMDAGEEGVASEESAEEGEAAEESEQEVESEEGSDEQQDEQAEESTFTIKVNGKDVTVTQSELIELGQKGLDYSQKTMAVAEDRRAVEAAKAQAEQYRQQHEQVLNEALGRFQALEQFYAGQVGQPPSIELAQHDAAQYLAQKELYENRKGQLEQARTAIQKLQNEAHLTRQAWISQQADATEKALRDTLPGWNDDTLKHLADYAGKLGLNPGTADVAFVQEGFWQAMHKAKAYDELLAKKAQMKPVAQLPKVAKPGTNNQPPQLAKRQDAMKRHKAAPSINTLADLL